MSKALKAIKDLTSDEMRVKVQEWSQELFKLRLQNSSGQLADFSQLRKRRKDIARAKTLLTVREGR